MTGRGRQHYRKMTPERAKSLIEESLVEVAARGRIHY